MKYDPKDLKDKIDEDIHEEVMGIPSRKEELVSEIEDTWVSLEACGADVDKIMQLVEDYIELHKLNPREARKMLSGGVDESTDEPIYVAQYRAERQKVKDKIRDIVGDDKVDEVFDYWDSIQSSFNMSWRHGGFYGDYREHLDKLADILGPEGRDIIADIQRKFDQQAKEMSDYYATHDYTGD